jgi:hypothetical protein
MNKSKYRYLLAGAFALSAIASIAKHTLGHIELTPDVGIAISKEYGRVVLVSDAQLIVPQIAFSVLWIYGTLGLFFGWRFSRECFLISTILFVATFFSRKLYLISAVDYVAMVVKVAAPTFVLSLAYLSPPIGLFRKRAEHVEGGKASPATS